MEQIKSRKRVKELAEVFTNKREVVAMLDLVQEDSYNIESKFLEPACGNGNFLEEICLRKFSLCRSEEDIVNVFRSIYAVDICPENIEETKNRLFNLFRLNYDKMIPNSILSEDLQIAVMSYLNSNVVRGDFLNDSIFFDMIPLGEIEFDVIIGNPPYQINTNINGSQAKPIYHKFVEKAIEMNPRYISFIIPARWYAGGMGLKDFRKKMLNDNHFSIIRDFKDASDCFPKVDISGGIMYFLRDKMHNGLTRIDSIEGDSIISSSIRKLNEFDILIRDNVALDIINKIKRFNETSFKENVFSQRPFGLKTNFSDFESKESKDNDIRLYARKKIGFISRDKILSNNDYIDYYKIISSKAYAIQKKNSHQITGTPILCEKKSACTETYIMIYASKSELETYNALSYFKSKFFRFLVSIKRIGQDINIEKFDFVPNQDMSIEWTDEMLYKKYNLTKEEIDYIESKIAVME